MVDQKIKRLADILVNYSIKIKKGDIISIFGGVEARPLLLELCKLILKKGALPRLNIGLEGASYIYFKYASEAQLRKSPKIAIYEARNVAGEITVSTENNTRELSNIDPKKLSIRRKVMKPIRDIYLKKHNWVCCEYPTNALAQEADMSLQEFEDFVFNATNIDWKKESKKQDKLKKILDKGNKVRIIGEDTDITFSIKGRRGTKCDGNMNMPDGEVFIAPLEKSTEGYIKYTYPAIFNSKEVDGVKLWFKKGKLVKATAEKNEKFLREMINTDRGSKYLGEFGIGVNYNIKKFIKNILFDEKIGGTIHLALGMAYKEGGGKNQSALHWDMIKDLKKGGELYIDGKLIQKNGKFTFKL